MVEGAGKARHPSSPDSLHLPYFSDPTANGSAKAYKQAFIPKVWDAAGTLLKVSGGWWSGGMHSLPSQKMPSKEDCALPTHNQKREECRKEKPMMPQDTLTGMPNPTQVPRLRWGKNEFYLKPSLWLSQIPTGKHLPRGHLATSTFIPGAFGAPKSKSTTALYYE